MPERDLDATMLARTGLGSGPSHEDRRHYLHLVQGGTRGQRIELGTRPVVIGRSAPADIVLADTNVSRAHCRLSFAVGEVIVVDLGSSNGTFVDGTRITGGVPLAVGSRLRVGSHVFEHELRHPRELKETQELDRDLEKAAAYLRALLPEPLVGPPISASWVLVPCARLGGDAFGYRHLDERHFAMYLIDVSGHGVGPAMHAASVINTLRQGSLPGTDFLRPESVMASLNRTFQMDAHDGLFLTAWYGVYDRIERTVRFASAGHHPSYLVDSAGRSRVPLDASNLMIGAVPAPEFIANSAQVPEGAKLYVFSDGAFEIATPAGMGTLEDFVSLLTTTDLEPPPEPPALLERSRARVLDTQFDDDFSVMAFTFS